MDLKSKKNGIILHNNQALGLELKQEIQKIDKNINLVIVNHFDDFFKHISNEEFDCLFIQHKVEHVNSILLVQKLRKMRKFYRSMIALTIENPNDLTDEDAIHYGLNFLINKSYDFKEKYIGFIQNYRQKLIPKEYQVLIVDDDPNIVEIISEYLKESGHHNFKTSSNFHDANQLVLSDDFDLILVDWNLGDGTCLDLVGSIRNATTFQRTKDATIVVITGRSEIDDVMTLVKHKINDHILKPFDYDEFEEKIEYALEKRNKT